MSYRHKHLKPKFKKLKPKKPFFKKPIFWILLGLIIFITLTYFCLFSWFQVSKITISGNDKVDAAEVENLVSLYVNKKLISIGSLKVYSKSLVLVNAGKLSQNILKEFPYIEEVDVRKRLPDGINITIKERSEFAIFCNSSDCYSIDENGVIYQSLLEAPIDALVLHKEFPEQGLYLGQTVVEKNVLGQIHDVVQALQENFQIGVRRVRVGNTLVFRTTEGWDAHFNSESDIKLQITELNKLLKDEIPEVTRKNLEYIYLQYKDRAYYK